MVAAAKTDVCTRLTCPGGENQENIFGDFLSETEFGGVALVFCCFGRS